MNKLNVIWCFLSAINLSFYVRIKWTKQNQIKEQILSSNSKLNQFNIVSI